MIKLTAAQIISPMAMQTIGKIRQQAFKGPVAYDLSKIFKDWMTLREEVSKEFREGIVNKYAKLDEKGFPQVNPEDVENFLIKEGFTKEAVDKAHDEFSAKTRVINRDQVSKDVFVDCDLTLADCEILEPIFVDEPSK